MKPIPLDAVEQEALREIIKKGTDWRERDRAEKILLLAAGQSVREVAAQQGCCEEEASPTKVLCLTAFPTPHGRPLRDS